jgi:RNA polymerase sigma-70 factor (ECF subfamily)
MTQADPRELARRAADRDPQAFAQLYDEHLNGIYRYVLYKVGDQTLAEDLTADVFAKAWEGIGRFQWRNLPFEHWLVRIARNVVIDHWRAHRRPTSPMDGLDNAPSEDPAPEEWVARDLEVEGLARALGALPDDQRDVLVLRFIEGYSHADVAAALGKSEVAVRQIQVRGLRGLQKLMRTEQETADVNTGDSRGFRAAARGTREPSGTPAT